MDYLAIIGCLGILFLTFIVGRVIGKREGYRMGWRDGHHDCAHVFAEQCRATQQGERNA